MRSTEYAPLFRSTIGFDRLFDLMENSVRTDWPPYNIEKTADDDYRITMAVAGFAPEEVDLTQHGPELIVTGQKKPQENAHQILHRGLAIGNFKQVFKLADYVKVASASLVNGLLTVQLVREIPEEMKPRRISVAGGGVSAAGDPRQMSQDARAQLKAA